jgi:SAM-dependent methyltransferase
MNFTESLDAEGERLLCVWNAQAPPLRPSLKDIELYEQGWKDEKGPRVLIQGATPELVDLALRKNASRVIAMDKNKSAFPAMRLFGCRDWKKAERLQNDWSIFVPDLEGKLDLVLGDGTLTLLTFPAEWRQTLENTYRYLVPGGRLILRLSFQPEESFEFDLYLKKTLSRFDAKCSTASPKQRLWMLREVISEIRIAFGLATSGEDGVVDLQYRAELVRFFHSEFSSRYGHWKEWEIARFAMPPEAEVRKGNRVGKGIPRWEAAADLIEACGFHIVSVKWSEGAPAPGAIRLFVAERT